MISMKSIKCTKSMTDSRENNMSKKKDNTPEGKFAATVKVGEKGQIVIPKGAREMFNIKPGDTLLVLADINQGIAIVKNDIFMQFAHAILNAKPEPAEEDE